MDNNRECQNKQIGKESEGGYMKRLNKEILKEIDKWREQESEVGIPLELPKLDMYEYDTEQIEELNAMQTRAFFSGMDLSPKRKTDK